MPPSTRTGHFRALVYPPRRHAQTVPRPDHGARLRRAVLRPGLLAAARMGDERHEDRPPRRPGSLPRPRWRRCGRRRIDLGAVQGAQYSGYLWPMGPVLRRCSHGLGLSPWVAQRIWLGAALRALGVGDAAAAGRPSSAARAAWRTWSAAGFYLLNPYTVDLHRPHEPDPARLRGAAVAAARGPPRRARQRRGWRDWRGWWWAAVFALVLTSIGGGINAAVVGWMLVGPLVLLALRAARRRACAGATPAASWCASACSGPLASLWWIVPLVVHARYGIDFLQFTEQPRSIWATNSAPEALRLMALLDLVRRRRVPRRDPAALHRGRDAAVQPARGRRLAAPARARRSRGFVLDAAVALRAVLPAAARGRRGDRGRRLPERHAGARGHGVDLPQRPAASRFMRTTQKAAPLVAIGVAGLLGLAPSPWHAARLGPRWPAATARR